jgi:uncharacterized membrane protein YeaQ/YmgE (transglycosylase-associated protein family)
MGIIAWIIVGLIAGALAKLLMPGNDPGGWILTIVLGIVGALVGGFLWSLIGDAEITGINFTSIAIATLGAVVVLAIYRMTVARR